MLKLFDILMMQEPELIPDKTILHLANWDGNVDPLDEFLAGRFEKWQAWQTKRNFGRDFIVSIIRIQEADRWLFAGAYRSKGCQPIEEYGHWMYETEEIQSVNDLAGKAIIHFTRPLGMRAYRYAEKHENGLVIGELKPEKLVVEVFPGYHKIILSKAKLDIIVRQGLTSWRSALSNVSGVYLITDTKTGKQYVGKATGIDGIWQRWCSYSQNGHGGNQDLIEVLKTNGIEYAANFQYSVLEIADTHASEDEIRQRERHWKLVLCSGEHGHNLN